MQVWQTVNMHVFSGPDRQRLLVGLVALWFLAGPVGCAAPLLSASAFGDTEKVSLLLRQGHHANETFPVIETRALTLAAASGHRETVKVLLDAGADVNAPDFTGWTALHAGAYGGDAGVVSLLLKHGAASSEGGWFLQTPAEIAETLHHKDVAELLRQTASPLSSGSTNSHRDSVESSFLNAR